MKTAPLSKCSEGRFCASHLYSGWCCIVASASLFNCVLQYLASLKDWHLPGWDHNGLVGLGIPAGTLGALFHFKAAEASELDLISRALRFLNLGEKCVQDFLRIRFGDSALLGHTSNQFSLVHKANSFLFLLIWISTLYMITASAAYHSGECSRQSS